MASVTTYKNVGIINQKRGNSFTKAYRGLMKQIGLCIKAGGYVEFDMVDETKANVKLFWC